MPSTFRERFLRRRVWRAKLINAVCVVAAVFAYASWAANAASADEAVRAQMKADEEAARAASSERGPYATDGVFTGTAQGYGGPVTTQVTVENGYITAVEVVEHSSETEAYFSQAEPLTETVVEAQTTAVDTVSGATFSSAGILNGATEALQQSSAGQGGE
ncbi:MAG: FMN-binding protein [Coriobacteriia bacterium]|nr:FMN-binding protein [Coriobacteriia bacterium]